MIDDDNQIKTVMRCCFIKSQIIFHHQLSETRWITVQGGEQGRNLEECCLLFPLQCVGNPFAPLLKSCLVDNPRYEIKRNQNWFQGALSQVSLQNITSILEDLLKDYDKTERPSYKDGIAVK